MSLNLSVVPASEAEFLLPILLDAEEGEERIWNALLDPSCVAYAARVDGQVSGAAVVRWEKDGASEILYIAVVAEQRGKGYGKLIIAGLQAELRKRSGQTLLVGTANSSLENLAFYQKCGFRMFEVRRDYFAYIQPPVVEHGIQIRDMLVLRYELE